ncbi:MAG: STAS domain-containing protein [Selenomonadaceae bacterium]|nr:STAS domain-containing protein [Selenomonadaceae bacterium]
MTVTVERNDNIKIIALDGQIDVATSDQTCADIVKLLEKKPTIIKMPKVTYVSSSGLRALLMIAKTAKSQGIKVTYAEAVPEVVDVLQMTGFIKMLHCVPTMADALKELGE